MPTVRCTSRPRPPRHITKDYYGKPVSNAYWNSCSNGGRQGLIEAQRFPEDFDGIVANAPWLDQTGFTIGAMWNQKALSEAPVTAAKMALVADKVMAKCDAIDGLKDGLIDDPRKCTFDPARDVPACSADTDGADCLTAAQAAAIAKVYGGPVSNGKPFFPGFMPGSEAVMPNLFRRRHRQRVDEHDRERAAGWQARGFRPGGKHDALSRAQAAETGLRLQDVRLSTATFTCWTTGASRPMRRIRTFRNFKKRGGKLLMTYGWADSILQPMMGVNYYEQAVAKNGPDTTDFFRLFMVPGMSHCSGGIGPDRHDPDDGDHQLGGKGQSPGLDAGEAASWTTRWCAHARCAHTRRWRATRARAASTMPPTSAAWCPDLGPRNIHGHTSWNRRTAMRIPSAAALSVFAFFALFACSRQPEKTGSAMKTLKIEPLKFTERTLPNGLRVYAMPDTNTANVSVQVWYDVGSKDDPAGRSGFAHLFEHIMFKATRNMPAEMLDRLTEDVGGENNASTGDDFTNYYEVVPANHLERLLWAEAERMGSLVVDKAIFLSERDVVKEEFRQRVLASPYGKLFLYLPQTNFSVHPYGRPGIGSIKDLDAATIEDVRAFHATYYRPDNAVLVVSGNFDPSQLDGWIHKYFGPIPAPKRPIPRVTAKEPARTAPRAYTVYEPNTPLPAVSVSYPSPEALSPDQAALSVLDAILSKGESSRLYQSMVYTQQIATEVFTLYDPTRDAGAYSLIAILSEGKPADDGLKSLSAEIARVRDGAVTAAELDEAKNELVSETLRGRETAFGRAMELANSVMRYRDARHADKLLDEIQTVRAEDVHRVARRVIDDGKQVTIRYLPEEAKPPGVGSDAIASAATIQAQKLDIPQDEIPSYVLAPEAERAKPPAPAAPVAAKLPAPWSASLPMVYASLSRPDAVCRSSAPNCAYCRDRAAIQPAKADSPHLRPTC